MSSRGLGSLGIRKLSPNQVNFSQAISGSLVLSNITTPTNIESGLGHIYIKSDGKLYFKSSMFEETDLVSGGGGTAINGLSFNLTSNILSIESDAEYGDTDTDGGDWGDISNGPSTKADASVVGDNPYTTSGYDFSDSTNGGDPSNNQYIINAGNASATTDNGTILTVTLEGEDDESPTDFLIVLKNRNSGLDKLVAKLRVTLDSNNTKITLRNLYQYEDDSSTTFSSVTVNIPFKVGISGTVTNVTRTLTIQKIRTGLEGTTARVVNLTADKIAFVYDENGANPVGNATITATALNTTPGATVYFEFLEAGVQQQIAQGDDDGNGIYSDTYTFTPQASESNMPRVVEVRIREQAGSATNTILARDQVTMIGVKPGSGAYQVVLGNPAHTAPTTTDGVVTLTDSSPKFLAVFKGSSRLTLKTTAGNPGVGEYKVTVTTPSDIVTADTSAALDTVGVGGGQNKDCVFDDHTGLSGNVGTVVYAVNCENTETVSAIQTVTRSNQGATGANGSAGTAARAVDLTATRQAVAFDEDGSLTSSTAITLTATARNTSGTIYYEFQVDDSTVQNTTTSTDSLTVSGTTFDDYPKKIEVLIREGADDNPVVARDQITIVALKPGKDGYTVVLSNEAHTVPVTTDGVITYTGSGTSVRVYKGTTELAAVATDATPGSNEFTVTGVSVGTGTLSGIGAVSVNTAATPDHILIADHSGTMSDNVVLTINVNVEGTSTIVKTQSISKSKQGATGQNGADGTSTIGVDLEIDPQVVVYEPEGDSPDVSSIRLTATTRNVGTEIARTAFFNNGSAYAYRNGGLDIPANNYMTVGFWIKFPSTETFTSTTFRYICYSDELQIHTYQDDLYFRHRRVGSDTLFSAAIVNYFNTSDAGKWVHVFIGRHYNGNLYPYKNGKSLGGQTSNGGSNTQFQAFDSTFRLGNDNNSSNQLGAELSNFVIWNTWGGSTQALQQYNSGKALTSPLSGVSYTTNVQVWYKLDEDQGTSSDTSTNIIDHKNSKTLTASTQLESVSNPGLFSRSGPSYFTFKVAGTVIGSENQTLNYADWTSIPSTYTLFKGDPKTAVVEMKSSNSTDSVEARDQGSIVALKEGEGGYTILVTNPTHTFTANTEGVVSSYTNSGTSIKVFKGGTALTIAASPAAGSKTFRVTGTSVSPSNRITPGAITNTNTSTSATVADHSNGSSAFSNTNGLFATITYTVNIEGTSYQATQNFAVAGKGAQGDPGDPGLNAGLVVDIDPPLAVVQTDRYGTPLTNALNTTETTIKVRDTTASDGVDAALNASDDPDNDSIGDLSNGEYKVSLNTTLTTSESGNYTYPGGSLTITHRSSDDDTTKIEKLATMTTEAVIRVFDIEIKNSSGDTFRMQAVQQIIKAVANVETLTPQIGKPIIQLIRDDYYNYYDPTISDYGAGATFIKLWKQTGTDDPELVIPAVSSDNTVTALSDAQMPNDSYKILAAETGNTLFPVINVTRGTLTYRTGNNARVEVGAPSGYPNGSFPEPMRIDYKIKYKDTAGNFHFIPLTQTIIPMDKTPPESTFQVRMIRDIEDDTASLLAGLKDNDGGFNDTHCVVRPTNSEFSRVSPGFRALDTDVDIGGETSINAFSDFRMYNLGHNGSNALVPTMGYFYQSEVNRFDNFDSFNGVANSTNANYRTATDTKLTSNLTANAYTSLCTFWYPGKKTRITGAASGQLRWVSMQWDTANVPEARRQFKFGMDLYKWNVETYLADTSSNIDPQYVGSFTFGKGTNDSSTEGGIGDPFAHIQESDGGSHLRAITGIKRFTTPGDPTVSTSSPMVISENEALLFVLYYDRVSTFPGNTKNAVPQSGECRFFINFNYYDLE